MSLIDPEALRDAVVAIDAAGFQAHFHAIGERAVREALDAVAAARLANGPTDTRPHIAHIQVIHPDDIAAFRPASTSSPTPRPTGPPTKPQMDELTIPFLGPERADLAVPVPIAARGRGDGWRWAPTGPSRPPIRCSDGGRGHADRPTSTAATAPPFLPDERLELDDALAAFTIGQCLGQPSRGRPGLDRGRQDRRPRRPRSRPVRPRRRAPSARRGSWRRSSTGSPCTRRPRSRADGRLGGHGRMTMSIRRWTTVCPRDRAGRALWMRHGTDPGQRKGETQ